MTSNRPNELPKARTFELVVKELPEEVLVYDLAANKAHCLNHTAGLVWKRCDGQTSVSEIARALEADTATAVDERLVWLALDQLEKFDLLEEVPSRPAHLIGMNRRQLVRTVGLAALALPMIMSISAPTAQAQASGLPSGACCSGPPECLSNDCSPGGSCTSPSKICS